MTILSEGGSLPGVGAIHNDEIAPTLDKLESILGIDLKKEQASFIDMFRGSLIGLISYFLVVLSRIITAKLSRGNLLASFLHPISILLFIYLLITSWIQHSRGNLSWKGRKL